MLSVATSFSFHLDYRREEVKRLANAARVARRNGWESNETWEGCLMNQLDQPLRYDTANGWKILDAMRHHEESRA